MGNTSSTLDIRELLVQARQAYLAMAQLPTETKNTALLTFADLLDSHHAELLAANQQDLAEQNGQLSAVLYQRLKLDESKLIQLAQGIRDVARLSDPSGQVLETTRLDDGLTLEKRSVPLGVIAIVFESRPDVIPQILSLILKSGNAVVLKGGQEAIHSNRAFMGLVNKLCQRCCALPRYWAQLLETREDFRALLAHPDLLDLVIPRGSNQLVQAIMAATRIPVLGHADGICHLYWHASANPNQALKIVLDAKTQYPTACNALETLLMDITTAPSVLPMLAQAAQDAGIRLRGCETTCALLPEVESATLTMATEEDWHTEYGDLTLAVKCVDGVQAAVAHINRYGSKHTDGILAEDPTAQQVFCNGVDSASVLINASTRFADGFRYGLGAEIGISTAKTHARGPVGLEGLVIYQYRLTGHGQVVADYVGPNAKPFKHACL